MTNDAQLLVRLPSSVLEDLDALADKLARPGVRMGRATIVRMLVMKGLDEELRPKDEAPRRPRGARVRRASDS
jgi:hypothetical protein